MNKAILLLGSNAHSAPKKIKAAMSRLSKKCTIEEATPVYVSELPYYNAVVLIETKLGFEDLLVFTKTVERQMGRRPEMKELGKVVIDVDIVVYNGEIKRTTDYSQGYFQAGYRKIASKL